jgi:hypothetical protein
MKRGLAILIFSATFLPMAGLFITQKTVSASCNFWGCTSSTDPNLQCTIDGCPPAPVQPTQIIINNGSSQQNSSTTAYQDCINSKVNITLEGSKDTIQGGYVFRKPSSATSEMMNDAGLFYGYHSWGYGWLGNKSTVTIKAPYEQAAAQCESVRH